MDYFITGGNGLLGSQLAARLLQSDSAHRVACLIRPKAKRPQSAGSPRRSN